MSKVVDERVVEMRFDNKDFEKNVSTSMSTIDKLKNALNFKGAAKGLDSVSTAAKSVNLSSLEKSIDSVKVKFDAMQVAGVTALANITNSIISTGRNMVSQFTIDPITDGFREYELQLNSVQTIMANTASKGTTIEQVTDALNELNEYADKTIYNFSEMTRNIGTFTAAGVDLETSVSAIQGIANLAAMSGSSSAQAAGAMYQLSQALAAGRVSLMDWNSVVNAGMGGEQFQNALKRTARNMGIAVDEIIAKYGSFRDSLTEGQWLTTDVLTETLKQLSGAYTEADLMAQGYSQDQAQEIVNMASTAEEAATKVKTFTQLIGTMKEAVGSGWAQTWQAVFGDFYEARDFWTSISDWMGRVIGDTADARTALFEGSFASGWEQLQDKIEATGKSFDDFQKYVIDVGNQAGLPMQDLIDKAGGLGKAFQNGSVSTDIAVDALNKWASEAENADQRSQALNQTFEDFKNTVKGIWTDGKFDEAPDKLNELSRAGYDYVEAGDLVKKIANGEEVAFENLTDEQLRSIGATDDQFLSLKSLSEQLMDTGSDMNRIMELLGKPSGRELFFSSIKNSIDAVMKPIRTFTSSFKSIFAIQPTDIYGFLEGFNHFTESLIISDETAHKLSRTFDGLFSVVKIFTSFLGGGVSSAFRVVQNVLDNLDMGFLDLTASIGDSLVEFSNFVEQNNIVNQALDVVADGITYFILKFQDFVNAVKESEVAAFAVKTLQDSFSKMVSAAKDVGGRLKDLFGGVIDALSNLEDLSFEEVMAIIKEFVMSAYEAIVSGIGNMVQPFIDGFSSIFEFITTNVPLVAQALGYFGQAVSDVFQNVIDWGKRIGPGGLFAILFSVGIVALVKKVASAIEALKSPIESLTGVIEGIGGSIERYFDARAFKVKTEGFKNLAISIAIVSAALVALGQLSPEQLFNASAAIVAISVSLTLVAGALSLLGKAGFDKVGLGFAGIGAAVLLVAGAFATMASIDKNSLQNSLDVVITVMGAMTVLAIALRKFGGGGGGAGSNNVTDILDTSAVQILALAASVRIITGAFMQLSTLDATGLQNAIFGMVTVLGSVLALTAIMSKFGGGLTGGLGLITTVIGIQAVIAVLYELANLDISSIVANLPNIIVVFGLVGALIAATSLAGTNAAKAGVGILGISAGIMIISKAINSLGSMDQGVMERGMSAVTQLMAIFAIIIAATNFAGKNAVKAGASIILMSGAILAISLAISLLSTLDPEGLETATTAIEKLLLMFALIVGASGYSKDASKTVLMLSVTIGVLVGAIAVLSGLEPDSVNNAVTCMVALMGAFAIMETATSKVGKLNSGMIAMLGVIVVLSGVIAALAALAPESAISSAASIGILLTAMSASLLLISKAGTIAPGALVTMGILTGVVAALAVVLGALSALDVEPSIDTAISLSILLGTMTGVTKALSTLGAGGLASVKASASGAASLAVVVTIIGGFMVALGALNKYVPQVQEFIQNGIPLLQSIGEGIGRFFGGIVGGFMGGAASGLPEVATQLSEFAENLMPFVNMMNNMGGQNALNGITMISDMFTKITAGNMLENINKFFGGGDSMTNFSTNLTAFGEAIAAFSESISGKIDEGAVTAAANAGKALAEMQSMVQGEGGIFNMFTGVKDLGDFAGQMESFGDAIVKFSDAVSGNIDEDAVTSAANAGKMLAELQKSIGSSGTSVVSLFAGEQDLEEFGTQIKAFGQAMVDFSATVSAEGAINETAVNNAANAGKIMSELQKSIDPNSESVVSFFSGQSNLQTFGTQIKAFGQAMVDFSSVITEGGGIDTEAITSAATAGEALSKLANSLPEYGIMDGQLNLSQFAAQMVTFATKLVAVSSTLGETDFTNIEKAATSATSVQQLLSNLQGIDESVINKFWVLDTLSTDLNSFANSISEVDFSQVNLALSAVSRVVTFINSLTGITGESVSGFSAAISNLGQISFDKISASFANVDFTSIGSKMVQSISAGFQNGLSSLTTTVKVTFSAISSYLNGQISIFQDNGLKMAAAFALGLLDGTSLAEASSHFLVTSAASGIGNYQGVFYSAGYNLALGFAAGINSGAYSAVIAAAAMAHAAAAAASAALAIHSPSRVMMQIGEYAGQGFVNGLSSYAEKTYISGRAIATSFVSGVSTIGDLLADESHISNIASSLSALSDSLRKTTDNSGAEDAADEESKLVSVLDSLTESLDNVLSRKSDLKGFNDILANVGDTLSDKFIAELLNSSGTFAGAIGDMAKLTNSQLQEISFAFEQQKLLDDINSITDTISESIDTISSRRSDLQAVEQILTRTGISFGNSFVAELLNSSGQYADTISTMAKLTDDQMQKIIDIFEKEKANKAFSTIADAVSENISSFASRASDLEGIQKLLNNSALSLSKDFVKELQDTSGQYAGAINEMAELTDEQIQYIADVFDQAKVADKISEITNALESEDGLIEALENSGIRVDEFKNKIASLGISADDVVNSITDVADSVSDGFNAMSYENQTSLIEYMSNLRNNIQMAADYEGNLNKLFDKIGDYEYADRFREALIKGGYDQFGQIVADLANANRETIIEFMELFNTADIYGEMLGTQITDSILPNVNETMMQLGYSIADNMSLGLSEGSESVVNSVYSMCNSVSGTVSDFSNQMQYAGYGIGTSVAQGVQESSNQVLATVQMLCDQIYMKFQNLMNNVKSMMQGLSGMVNAAGSASSGPQLSMAGVSNMIQSAINNSQLNNNNATNQLNAISSMAGSGGSSGVQMLSSSIDMLSDKIDKLDSGNFGTTFNQYNTSPKALSTAEIYRGTRNQISLAKTKLGKNFM